VSSQFRASAGDIQALANFLVNASEVSREIGVWFCAYGPTEVTIPGGSTVRVTVDGEGDLQSYVVDDQIGG
jgi:hypothetical protein